MLLGLVSCIIYIMYHVPFEPSAILSEMADRGMTKIFNTDVNSASYFLKSIIGGIFITVGMTGLDQEMMQKNISVKTLRDSQKNMMTFSITMVVVNFLFLILGGLLYLFAESNGIKTANDDLFPTVALSHMPTALSIVFIIGLISALFPSADGALTALTSSYCIDILGLKRRENLDEKAKKKIRLTVHFTFAAIFFVMVILFKLIDNKSIIDVILKVAGFTYGPLLGLFAFGILSKKQIHDKYALYVCLAAPLIILGIDYGSQLFFDKFKIGYELLIYNGLLTYLGLLMISKKEVTNGTA